MKVKLPKAQRLRKNAIKELLSDPQWTRDLALEALYLNKITTSQYYAHPSGQLLLRFNEGRALLHPDRELWIQHKIEIEEKIAKGSQHILAERLLYGREFDQHIPDLISGLAQIFKMAAETFDYKPDDGPTLDTMTRKVKARGRINCLDNPVIFSGLVAYLTETGRRYVNGRIQMIESWSEPKAWEPWVIDPQGNAFNVWSKLFDTLLENEYGIILDIGTDIGSRRPRAYEPRPKPTNSQRTKYSMTLIREQPAEASEPNAHKEEKSEGDV
jgi:hypothetical protein